ncbi:MAG: hypothetical protein AB7G28_18870 [Pirellulales bacterium]
MQSQSLPAATIAVVFLLTTCCQSDASSELLTSPDSLIGAPRIDFEGYSHYTLGNTLYLPQGIEFSRDDGQGVLLYEWPEPRITSSPRNVLATVSGPGAPIYVSSLNILSSSPLRALGFYFGNDQGDPDFTRFKLSAFAIGGELVAAYQVDANNNTNVDQFVGIRSDVPFTRVRLDNLNSAGNPTQDFSVVIDDLMYSRVPEPSSLAMCVLLVGWPCRRAARRRSR